MVRKPTIIIEMFADRVIHWVGSLYSIAVHTFIFVASFLLVCFHVTSLDRMLLVLTTVVSLEAIYLAIFIQMSLNRATKAIQEVGQDIDEIQEDVG